MGRDDRYWFRVDCGFWDDPKMLAAGRDGRDLFLVATAWCASNLTDGHIPADALPIIAAKAGVEYSEALDAVEKLVTTGAWTDLKDGWLVTRYVTWQTTRSEVEAKRAQTRERVARWRAQQRRGDLEAVTSEDAVTRYPNGDALRDALVTPRRSKKVEEEVPTGTPTSRGRKRPISAEADKLARLLMDRHHEFMGTTPTNPSHATRRAIQDLLDIGPPNAKPGGQVTPERIEQMVDLLHTKGREEWRGTCWAEQVQSGVKLREKWTFFEGKWMSPNGRVNGEPVASASQLRARQLSAPDYDPRSDHLAPGYDPDLDPVLIAEREALARSEAEAHPHA